MVRRPDFGGTFSAMALHRRKMGHSFLSAALRAASLVGLFQVSEPGLWSTQSATNRAAPVDLKDCAKPETSTTSTSSERRASRNSRPKGVLPMLKRPGKGDSAPNLISSAANS